MFPKLSFALAFAAVVSTAPMALAADDITVTGAWARPSIGDAGSSAMYFTIVNSGPSADSLISAEVPDAAQAQMHESTDDNGVVGMHAVAELPLAPGKPVAFAPKGNHVMLMGLKHPFKVGDHIAAILHFKAHAPIAVDAVVSMTAPPQ